MQCGCVRVWVWMCQGVCVGRSGCEHGCVRKVCVCVCVEGGGYECVREWVWGVLVCAGVSPGCGCGYRGLDMCVSVLVWVCQNAVMGVSGCWCNRVWVSTCGAELWASSSPRAPSSPSPTPGGMDVVWMCQDVGVLLWL